MTKIRSLAVFGLTVTLLAGCAGTSGGGGQPPGVTGAMSLSIVEPMNGATLAVPFTVKVIASVPLGATTTGLHHVHVWFDGNTADYVLVESDTVTITQAPAGAHTMNVSLRNANHTAAGADTKVDLTITGSATPSPSASDDGGYGD